MHNDPKFNIDYAMQPRHGITYDWNGNSGMHALYADLCDYEVARQVRMLTRKDVNHEMVCCMARDRIMALSKEVARLTALAATKTGHPNIESTLSLSTGHLSAGAQKWLNEQAALNDLGRASNSPAVAGAIGALGFTLYGWFTYAPMPESLAAYDCPDDLKAIFAYAREAGAAYILFDADADHAVGLPSFDADAAPEIPMPAKFQALLNAADLAELVKDGRDLIEQAMEVHIYDADQGEVPDQDCRYAAHVKAVDSKLAEINDKAHKIAQARRDNDLIDEMETAYAAMAEQTGVSADPLG